MPFIQQQIEEFSRFYNYVGLLLFCKAENAKRRLIYFGRKFPIDPISLSSTPFPTNSIEKDLAEQTKSLFIRQNQIAHLSLRWATFTDWLFYRLIPSLGTRRISHAATLLRLSTGIISARSLQLHWSLFLEDFTTSQYQPVLQLYSQFILHIWWNLQHLNSRRWCLKHAM